MNKLDKILTEIKKQLTFNNRWYYKNNEGKIMSVCYKHGLTEYIEQGYYNIYCLKCLKDKNPEYLKGYGEIIK